MTEPQDWLLSHPERDNADTRLDDRLVMIEANAAWASGIYQSDADAALDVILRSAAPAGDVSPRDKAFIRPIPARTILTKGGAR